MIGRRNRRIYVHVFYAKDLQLDKIRSSLWLKLDCNPHTHSHRTGNVCSYHRRLFNFTLHLCEIFIIGAGGRRLCIAWKHFNGQSYSYNIRKLIRNISEPFSVFFAIWKFKFFEDSHGIFKFIVGWKWLNFYLLIFSEMFFNSFMFHLFDEPNIILK